MANDLVLRMERILPAPRAVVFGALSDAGELARWWGPHGFTAPSVDFEPRVGARYRIAMQPPGGEPFHLAGEFLEVDPPARLTYTFRWDPPDPDDRRTVARLSLKERGERTELVLTQGSFATEERLELHRQGWADTLERLEELLLAKAQLRVSNHWVGGHHSRSVIGDLELESDAPPSQLAANGVPNPAEYMLHALAASLATSIVDVAPTREVELEWLESTITADMDMRCSRGNDPVPYGGFERIDVLLRLAGNAPDNELRELVKRAKEGSAVYDVVARAVPVGVEVITA